MNNNKNKEEIEFRILESKGKALLDREIMETFLSAVHERPQAQEIAKNLVNTYAGVGRILGREMDDLKVIEGVTDSAVAMIMCVKETLERVLREKLKSEPIMDLQGLVEYLNVSIGHSERECVKILYLNKRRQLIGEESYIGEMEKAPVYIKEITRKALIKNATLVPDGDDVMERYGHCLENIKWLGYLSATNVYGDHCGNWVNEESETKPIEIRGEKRLESEKKWLSSKLPVHIFRLAGIYGPGRNALIDLQLGKARNVKKIFSRVHVEDISNILFSSMQNIKPYEIYNCADDLHFI